MEFEVGKYYIFYGSGRTINRYGWTKPLMLLWQDRCYRKCTRATRLPDGWKLQFEGIVGTAGFSQECVHHFSEGLPTIPDHWVKLKNPWMNLTNPVVEVPLFKETIPGAPIRGTITPTSRLKSESYIPKRNRDKLLSKLEASE